MPRINFEIEEAEILSEESDSQFADARLRLFSSGENLHDMTCTPEVLKKTAFTSYLKPIIFEIKNNDFGNHSDYTIPAGFIVSDSAEFIEQDDGRLALFCNGKIWKRYSGNFLEVFRKNATTKAKLSVEMELLDSEEREDGLLEMLDFAYAAATILGQTVTEASPDANIEMLSFSSIQEEYNKDLEKEFSISNKYDEHDLDFTIPQSVKNSAKQGLELYKKHSKGGNSVSLSVARHIVKSDKINPDKVKRMFKHFKKTFDNLSDKESDDWIAYQLYGGSSGKKFCNSIVEKMEEIDRQKMSYFAEDKMPYSSLKDINPSLKGINPPISLAQANEIAKQADAIGADKKGWPIAISNFKKNHKVEDGKWVKMSSDGNTEFALSKEEWGKGKNISVDKSKDSVSSSAWGSVNKSSLMEEVLKASNYKSLVKDVYLLVESGWEDHPSSSLKYPVMQISDGKFVYNRGALAAALGRAKGQNESEVVSKVEGIYKKLGLDNSEKEVKNSMKKEKFAEEETPEEEKGETPEQEKQEEDMSVDPNEKEETPAEEKKESPEEEKKEKDAGEEKEMSLDAYLDIGALQKFLEDETEMNEELVSEFSACEGDVKKMNWPAMAKGLFDYCQKMSVKNKEFCGKFEVMESAEQAYMAENKELREFKANVEKSKFDYEVDMTMKEIENSVEMPKEEFESIITESAKFSLDSIDAWKNLARAKAFSYASKSKKEKDGFVKYAINNPFAGKYQATDNGSPWKL